MKDELANGYFHMALVNMIDKAVSYRGESGAIYRHLPDTQVESLATEIESYVQPLIDAAWKDGYMRHTQEKQRDLDAAVKNERERIGRLLRTHLTLTSKNRLELSARKGQEIFDLICEPPFRPEKSEQ